MANLALGVWLFLFAALGIGCATPQAFVPLAEVTAAAPDGLHGAADYRLEQPSRSAHVQVWSRGAYRDDTEGKATIVHVGFSLENQGAAPIRLDERRLFLEDVGSTEGGLERLPPARLEGNVSVAPNSTGNVDAYFRLPWRIWPSDVFGYRVAWALEGGESARVQHTAFQSTRFGPRGYFAYSPYYPWGYYPYYPWGPYALYYAPYPYWGGPPFVRARVYFGPRVLARPRFR